MFIIAYNQVGLKTMGFLFCFDHGYFPLIPVNTKTYKLIILPPLNKIINILYSVYYIDSRYYRLYYSSINSLQSSSCFNSVIIAQKSFDIIYLLIPGG